MKKTSKKSRIKLKLMIAVLILSALFLSELYVMINVSHNIVLVAGIAVLILIALYFVVDAILDNANEKDIAIREQYDNIYRSEKASYMLLKKKLEELSKQVKDLNERNAKSGVNSAEIIKAQKAIAKVTMSKSKETQDRLFIELNNLEASLKDSVHSLSEKLFGFQEEIERLAEHIAEINTEAIREAARSSQEIKKTIEEKNVAFDEVVEEIVTEESSLEDILAETEIGVQAELDGMDSLPDDIEAGADELDFGNLDLGELELDASSPVETEEDVLSQLAGGDDDDILSQLKAAEEAVPIKEPAPAPADNGGKMDQDDIAALIANMTGGNAAPVEEPEVKEKPAAPVADNPNKMMTPEEIAALIAGM